MDKYETHEHDVVVIGAGGAGLRAAIEASAAGAKTAQNTLDGLRESITSAGAGNELEARADDR